jgi:LPXTG-motif cell wall-anchored protein
VAFFAAIGLGAAVVWLARRLPGRLPKYYVTAIFAVAVATATGLVLDSSEFPPWAWAIVAGIGVVLVLATLFLPRTVDTKSYLTATATAVVVLGAVAGVTFVDGWSRWNFEGYEAKDPWPEYEALMTELDRLPDGRVMWENNAGLNQYGTPMSPMLIPYWTEGSHKSMEGVYFESSLTTPFHFVNHSEMSYQSSNPIPGLPYDRFNFEKGIQHMDVYGVDYYVSFTPEAGEKGMETEALELITVTEPFRIFRLPPTEKVEALTHLPAVYEVPERSMFSALIGSEEVTGEDGEALPSFHDMAMEWYVDFDNLDRLVVADGPDQWPRIETLDERPDVPLEVPADAVSDVVVDDHMISFTTEAVGVPHVVKVSYFPNWEASGADGPWRATPSLMVVVPTQSDVVIAFNDTWAESGGKVLTLAGVVGLAGGAFVVWRRREDRES